SRFFGPPGRRLIEDFLNLPANTDRVLVFTRKYGPIQAYPRPGQKFRFQVSAWTKLREGLRTLWKHPAPTTAWELGPRDLRSVSYEDGFLTITVQTLYEFLCIDLVTCAREKRRFCTNPQCANPFFIAHHLGQNYCADTCSRWGQRQYKRKWWAEKGPEWRRKRRKRKLRRQPAS